MSQNKVKIKGCLIMLFPSIIFIGTLVVFVYMIKRDSYPMWLIQIGAGLKNNATMVSVGIIIPLLIFILQLSKDNRRVKASMLIALGCFAFMLFFIPYKTEIIFNSEMDNKIINLDVLNQLRYLSMTADENNVAGFPILEYPEENTIISRYLDNNIATITCFDSKDIISGKDLEQALLSREQYKKTQIYGYVIYAYEDRKETTNEDRGCELLSVLSYEFLKNSEIETVLMYYDGKPCYCMKTKYVDNLIQSVEKETLFSDTFYDKSYMLGKIYMNDALSLRDEYQ